MKNLLWILAALLAGTMIAGCSPEPCKCCGGECNVACPQAGCCDSCGCN